MSGYAPLPLSSSGVAGLTKFLAQIRTDEAFAGPHLLRFCVYGSHDSLSSAWNPDPRFALLRPIIEEVTAKLNHSISKARRAAPSYVELRCEWRPLRAGYLHEDRSYLHAIVPLSGPGTWLGYKGRLVEAPPAQALIMAGQIFEKCSPGVVPALHAAPDFQRPPRIILVIDYVGKSPIS
jgi:hypothetical protein